VNGNADGFSDGPQKQILFVGLGNVLRQDDGVGVYVARRIRENRHIRVLTVEIGIENYLGKINAMNPDFIILLDSVVFNRKPGYCRLLPAARLMDYTSNTHNISLSRITEFVHAETYILGIEPATVSFGEGLTPAVKRKADLLIKKINEGITCI
jgi:hydrogenase maturation protease